MLQFVTNLDVAVTIILISSSVGSILTLIFSKWLLNREAKKMIKTAIDSLFGDPLVKRSMSIIGTKSGEKRHDERIINEMATDFLNNPNMKGVKMAAKGLGFDIDEYITEHGASDTIQGITSLGQMLGIDVIGMLQNPQALLDGFNRESSEVTSDKNPYL